MLVVKALGATGDARAVEPLGGILGCRGGALREPAGWALEQIDPQWRSTPAARKAVPQYTAALKDKAWTKRQSAALALGVMCASLASTTAHIATLDEAVKQQAQDHEAMRLL